MFVNDRTENQKSQFFSTHLVYIIFCALAKIGLCSKTDIDAALEQCKEQSANWSYPFLRLPTDDIAEFFDDWWARYVERK